MDTKELEVLISECLSDFYESRLQKVRRVKLHTFLRRKNPYLFRALGIQKASEIIERLLTAYVSSSDETIFGNAFFEPIARIASGGKASDAEGIDFVIESSKSIKAIALKSGPNIFNSSQKKRQSQEFSAVRNRLYKLHKQFDPILGHAYGRVQSKPGEELIYRDSSGQAFWQEITGDPDFYLKLVKLMKNAPAKHRKEYMPAWDAAVNRFTKNFIDDFCFDDGTIDWEKLVQFVSEEKTSNPIKKPRKG
jgi:hypothetical protein